MVHPLCRNIKDGNRFEKCHNTESFLVLISPYLDSMRRDTEYLSVFSPNTGKYGTEKTSYLEQSYCCKEIQPLKKKDTHAILIVMILIIIIIIIILLCRFIAFRGSA